MTTNTVTAEPVAPNSAALAQPSAKRSLVVRTAERFSVDADKLLTTLKATAFRQRADNQGNVREPTNEEMMALLILADHYGLNPFTKELFAYYDPKSKAIIPIVSVDGWIRIINAQPSLRSLSFVYSPETVQHKGKTCHVWIECEIVRSDRDKPVVIREYFEEVVRRVDFATPWDSHPNRMHRHKVLIQAGRYAFGFGGIYDQDEAERIIEGEHTIVTTDSTITDLNAEIAKKKNGNGNGHAPAPAAQAPQEQPAEKKPAPMFSDTEVEAKLKRATDIDALNDARAILPSLVGHISEERHQVLHHLYETRRDELLKGGAA